jgi:hypothetical protein
MYYYVLATSDSVVKVGITKDLDQRLRNYRTANTQLVYFKTYDLGCDRKEARRIEREILTELKRWYTCRSETVYSGSPERVSRVVEGIIEELTIERL